MDLGFMFVSLFFYIIGIGFIAYAIAYLLEKK